MKKKISTLNIFLCSVLLLVFSLLCTIIFTENKSLNSTALGGEIVSILGVPCETETLSVITENMSGDLTYQWQYCDTIDGTYTNITGATSNSYTIPSISYNGKYLKVVVGDSNGNYEQVVGTVGNFIQFDLAKGVVNLSASYSGYSADYITGSADVIGTHQTNNIYYVTQSNPTEGTMNNIVFGGNGLTFNLTINGINSIASGSSDLQGGAIVVPAMSGNKKYVTIRVMGNNYMKQIFYSTGSGSNASNYINNDSTLKITSVMGDGATNGVLNIANNVTWSAGIGGIDSGSAGTEGFTGLTIAGATINVTSDRSSAIGGGGNGYSQITITGGIINATNGGTGATIGGGGGLGSAGGAGNITISGGVINATNNGYRNTTGVAIGGSGSEQSIGSKGTVTITGGIINANGGIGGGNSTNKTGGDADINISGGTITSNSIGGGYSNMFGYNSADVTITGGSINSSIAGKPTNGTEQVYLTKVTMYAKDVLNPTSSIAIINTQVEETTLNINNANYYVDRDISTDKDAVVYLWLPEQALVVNCNLVIDGIPTTFNGAVSAKSIGVLKNDEALFYVVNIAHHQGYTLYYNNTIFDGSKVVRADSSFAFELELKIGTVLNHAYRSTINGTINNLAFMSNNNGRYQYQLTVNTNTYVWFAITQDEVKRLTLDLYAGDVKIEVGTNVGTSKITYAGYLLDNFDGEFYISSNFYPATNTIQVLSGTHDIYIDKLVSNHDNSVITIEENAILNLSASTENNQIYSRTSPVITVNNNGTLNLTLNQSGANSRSSSLKLYGGINSSVIGGEGNVNIIKKLGFLELNLSEGSTKSQITAKRYSYATNSLNGTIPYSLTMVDGSLVGYQHNINEISSPSATYTISTDTTFTACAISYVKSDTVTCVASIDANNAIINLAFSGASTVNSIIIKREGNLLTESTDWSYDVINQAITINGGAVYNNLNIEIITAGEIVYLTNDYNGVYDGNAHSISITVSSPNIYVIEYSLDNINFSSTVIEQSDVCNITVYWRITAFGYTTQTGNNSIIITKGYNSWNSSLICSSFLVGETANPQAESRFGNENLEFTYYQFNNANLSLEQLTSSPTTAGEYYVKAMVAGTINYYDLTSEYVIFVIKNNITFVLSVINYNQLFMQGEQIDIYSNKYATILYDFYYFTNAGDMALYTNELPNGTKIVFIDYSASLPVFYYYNLSSNMDEIYLSNFKKMGTTIGFIPTVTNEYIRGKFQFCITFPKDYNVGSIASPISRSLTLSQNGAVKGSVLLKLFGALTETETTTTPTIDTQDNCLCVDTTISAIDRNEEFNKVLVYTLLDSSGNDVILVDNNGDNPTIKSDTFAELYLNDEVDNKIKQYFVGNSLFYDLGTTNITNNVAHLIIHNLPSGNYVLKINIRATTLTPYYCLNGVTVDNQKLSAIYNYTHVSQIAITSTRVQEINEYQDRLIDKNVLKSLEFNITSIGYDLSSLKVELYKKNAGNYSLQQEMAYETEQTLTDYNKIISINIPSVSPGTYRLKFLIGDLYKSYYIEYSFLIKY